MGRQAGIWPRGRQGTSSAPSPIPLPAHPVPSCVAGPCCVRQRWPQHLAAAARRTSGSRRWAGARSAAGSPPSRPGPVGRCCRCGTRSRRGSCYSGTARKHDSAPVLRTRSAGAGRQRLVVSWDRCLGEPCTAGQGKGQRKGTGGDRRQGRVVERGQPPTEQMGSRCSQPRQWLGCPRPQPLDGQHPRAHRACTCLPLGAVEIDHLDAVIESIHPVEDLGWDVQAQPVGPQDSLGGDEDVAVGTIHPGSLNLAPLAVLGILLPVCPVHPPATDTELLQRQMGWAQSPPHR